jgi:ATP-dependent RNA helicase DDX35
MSKRRLDETGFWKPNSSSIKDDGSTRDSESSSNVFNFNRSPLFLQRQTLPIAKHRRQILYALEHYSVLIIVGETGSGKSTQIPQYLMENGWCEDGYSVVCTQPRRIAAQTIAQRVSKEAGCTLGDTVGYKVRFDDVTSPATCVKYVTDGTLLREATLSDPLLSKYSVIMIDEAHERNMNTDALLGIVKKIRRKRKDLRVIVCSATIDAESFLDFFIPKKVRKEIVNNNDRLNKDDGGNVNDGNYYDNDAAGEQNNSKGSSSYSQGKRRKRRWGKVGEGSMEENTSKTPSTSQNESKTNINIFGTIISIDGRQHPVDILHVKEPVADYIKDSVDTALRIHYDLTHDDGDILAFLPTGEDIDRAIHYANETLSSSFNEKRNKKIEFYPLYGGLPYHMQSKVFQPKMASDSTRRVIFATNIAETSVTVPHISSVIDCGYVKLPYYDTNTGFDRLVIR